MHIPKKITFGMKVLFTVIIVLIPIVYIGVFRYSMFNNPPNKSGYVTWTADNCHEAIINWETASESGSFLEISADPEFPSQSVITKNELSQKQFHHMLVDGLEANTVYYYRIRLALDEEPYTSGQFLTAPESSMASFKAILFSDAQQPFLFPSWHARTARQIMLLENDASFITSIGDHVCFGNYKPYYDNFFTSSSVYMQKIPYVPVVGNHEFMMSFDKNLPERVYWFDYFTNSIGQEGEFYYSFNYSMAHFSICHLYDTDGDEFSETQETWLKEDLARNHNKSYRIVMFHTPLLGSGMLSNSFTMLDKLQPIFKQYNVTAVFSGHEHHYERILYDGMHYFILGGGGSVQDPINSKIPESEAIAFGPSYTRLEFNISNFTITTVNLGGNVLDKVTYPANNGMGGI